jgi:hypothetical protein
MLHNFLFSIPLLGICLVPNTQAEELPANFVWCDCICGNYNPLDFMCVVSVPDRHVSRYLSNIAPLSLRLGSSVGFRSACENPAVCGPADVFPWSPKVSQMPFKGFVAVKLQASNPFGPIPVGTPIKLRGSAYEPLWDSLFPAK